MLDSFICRNNSVMMRIREEQPYIGGPKIEVRIDKQKQKLMQENPFCLYMRREDVITLEDLKKPPPMNEKQILINQQVKQQIPIEQRSLSKLLSKKTKKPTNKINLPPSQLLIDVDDSNLSQSAVNEEVNRNNQDSFINILDELSKEEKEAQSICYQNNQTQQNYFPLDVSEIHNKSQNMVIPSKTPKSNSKGFFGKFKQKKKEQVHQ